MDNQENNTRTDLQAEISQVMDAWLILKARIDNIKLALKELNTECGEELFDYLLNVKVEDGMIHPAGNDHTPADLNQRKHELLDELEEKSTITYTPEDEIESFIIKLYRNIWARTLKIGGGTKSLTLKPSQYAIPGLNHILLYCGNNRFLSQTFENKKNHGRGKISVFQLHSNDEYKLISVSKKKHDFVTHAILFGKGICVITIDNSIRICSFGADGVVLKKRYKADSKITSLKHLSKIAEHIFILGTKTGKLYFFIVNYQCKEKLEYIAKYNLKKLKHKRDLVGIKIAIVKGGYVWAFNGLITYVDLASGNPVSQPLILTENKLSYHNLIGFPELEFVSFVFTDKSHIHFYYEQMHILNIHLKPKHQQIKHKGSLLQVKKLGKFIAYLNDHRHIYIYDHKGNALLSTYEPPNLGMNPRLISNDIFAVSGDNFLVCLDHEQNSTSDDHKTFNRDDLEGCFGMATADSNRCVISIDAALHDTLSKIAKLFFPKDDLLKEIRHDLKIIFLFRDPENAKLFERLINAISLSYPVAKQSISETLQTELLAAFQTDASSTQVSTFFKSSIEPRLERLQLICQKQSRDGNCLFHSVAKCLDGEYSHSDLRKDTVEYLKEHVNDLKSFLPDFSEESYLERLSEMEKDGVWGDILEVYALAQLLNRPIVIIHSNPNRNHIIINESSRGVPIFLFYTFGIHYDALIPFPSISPEKIYEEVALEQENFQSAILAATTQQYSLDIYDNSKDEEFIAMQHAIFLSLLQDKTQTPKLEL